MKLFNRKKQMCGKIKACKQKLSELKNMKILKKHVKK